MTLLRRNLIEGVERDLNRDPLHSAEWVNAGLALALVEVHLPTTPSFQHLCSRGYQSFFNRPGPDLSARMNAELEHDVTHMRFDGPFADHQILGDLTVAFSLCNQSCHLTLPHGQPSKGLFGSAVW